MNINDKLISFLNTSKIYEKEIIQFLDDWNSNINSFEFKTSGSTGVPKQIVISKQKLIQSAKMTQTFLNLNENDKALICLNANYVAGKMMLVRCLVINMEGIVVEPCALPLEILNPKTCNFTFAAFVPYQMFAMLKSEQKNYNLELLNRFKAIIIGGDTVNSELENLIQDINAPVFLTFGMTETVSHIAMKRLNGINKTNFFETLPGVEIKVNHDNCLQIKSPTTDFNWMQTNDVVDFDLNFPNRFVWRGRFDNVIISGGIKIQLEEVEFLVEKVLKEHNIMNRFVLIGINDVKLNQQLVLVIESVNKLEEVIEKSIKKSFETGLEKYKLPKKIIYLPQLELTPTNKINRTAVKNIVEALL
jgi:o-succinylbenzoate---CoA ligase